MSSITAPARPLEERNIILSQVTHNNITSVDFHLQPLKGFGVTLEPVRLYLRRPRLRLRTSEPFPRTFRLPFSATRRRGRHAGAVARLGPRAERTSKPVSVRTARREFTCDTSRRMLSQVGEQQLVVRLSHDDPLRE